jgi:single-strand DNA-binding protein
MMGVNRVFVAGHLGQDPECRATADGKWVATLNLATSRKWKDAEGQPREETEWHRLVSFGRSAELARQYLKKGSAIFVEGRLQTREWEDKEGRKRWTTEIVVDNFQFLGSPRRDADTPTVEAGEPAGPLATNGAGRNGNGAKAPPARGPARKASAALADIPF